LGRISATYTVKYSRIGNIYVPVASSVSSISSISGAKNILASTFASGLSMQSANYVSSGYSRQTSSSQTSSSSSSSSSNQGGGSYSGGTTTRPYTPAPPSQSSRNGCGVIMSCR